MAKPNLKQFQLDDASRLRAIWNDRKGSLQLSQAGMSKAIGVSQGTINGYLNGHWPLNMKAAALFAKELQCSVADFSPSLQAEIDAISAFRSSNAAGIIALLKSAHDPAAKWPFTSVTPDRIARLGSADRLRIEGLIDGLLVNIENSKRRAGSNPACEQEND